MAQFIYDSNKFNSYMALINPNQGSSIILYEVFFFSFPFCGTLIIGSSTNYVKYVKTLYLCKFSFVLHRLIIFFLEDENCLLY